MGIFDLIGKIFGGSQSNEVDSRITVRGDVSPIPQKLITPDYRPKDGVYITSAADLLREWEQRSWMLSPEDLQQLKTMHQTLQNYEKLSKEYGKELGKFARTEAKVVNTVTKAIPQVAGGNFAQYGHNQRLNSDMDKIAAEYQKNIALRQAEAQKVQQSLSEFKAKMQQRKDGLRGQ
ncbi:hypothetical protein [Planktothrix pseudagardhii]|uniref:Uncharacterized protein n=1 Tax=Planktothrix pseudagardhii TaxID=132604 RepID=A0A9W4CUE5_9CYAN|nr:hypothetical protein [Planktothrix pseudagardhii]CAD5988559.1 hypothetical protein NO713_05736 [Planktothrix pseudagardhii]